MVALWNPKVLLGKVFFGVRDHYLAFVLKLFFDFQHFFMIRS
jgi:hypothetical protein